MHAASLETRLAELHDRIRHRHPCIDRIALALYDPQRRCLGKLIDSVHGETRPRDACWPVDAVPELAAVIGDGRTRVLMDLASGAADHAGLHCQGCSSSLAHPVLLNGELLGVLLFDSRMPEAFGGDTVEDLTVYAHLMGAIITQELASVQMLVGSLRLARNFAHLRDIETGAHLDRMAHYAHLIARELAPVKGHDSEFVEHIFLFAPLHDIGKVGVPDRILLKPGKFTDAEREIMNSHVTLGVDMIEHMIGDFGLGRLAHLGMLRNIVAHHHEYLDGSGYPDRLAGDAIPLEARIVAAADVLDALSCARSYKKAWPFEDALAEVSRMSGSKLDQDCVDALLRCREEVQAIHHRFDEGAHYRY